MIDGKSSRENADFNFYGPQYSRFDSPIAAEIRAEVYGEDIGQQGGRTSAEQAEIADQVQRGLEIRGGARIVPPRQRTMGVGLTMSAAGSDTNGKNYRSRSFTPFCEDDGGLWGPG